MADLEPYMQWFFHDASFENVHDGNLKNGTIVQVYAYQIHQGWFLFLDIGGMWYMVWYKCWRGIVVYILYYIIF